MGDNQPRITIQTLKVLTAIASSANGEASGTQIADVTKLASGTLYPILFRLEQSKWLLSCWEEGDRGKLGRPLRRYYWLTPRGAKQVKASLREFATFAEVAWES